MLSSETERTPSSPPLSSCRTRPWRATRPSTQEAASPSSDMLTVSPREGPRRPPQRPPSSSPSKLKTLLLYFHGNQLLDHRPRRGMAERAATSHRARENRTAVLVSTDPPPSRTNWTRRVPPPVLTGRDRLCRSGGRSASPPGHAPQSACRPRWRPTSHRGTWHWHCTSHFWIPYCTNQCISHSRVSFSRIIIILSRVYVQSLTPSASTPPTEAGGPRLSCAPRKTREALTCARARAPHPPRNNRTRRVLHPVLIGHAAFFTPY